MDVARLVPNSSDGKTQHNDGLDFVVII